MTSYQRRHDGLAETNRGPTASFAPLLERVLRNSERAEQDHHEPHRNSTLNILRKRLLHHSSANEIFGHSYGSRHGFETGCEGSKIDGYDVDYESDVLENGTSHAATDQYWHNSSMPLTPNSRD